MKQILCAKGLIDGKGEEIRSDVAVEVEGNKITDIKTRDMVNVTSEDIVIDLGEDYLLPGFIDSHSHGPIRPGEGDQVGQFMDPPAIGALRSANNLRRSLKSGVTTMRSMHAEEDLDVYLRESIESNEIPGPRLFISGGAITPSNGLGAYTEVDTPDDIRRSIRRSVKVGADFIKIFCDPGNYSKAEIQLAVDEAHNMGKRISAHVLSENELRTCVECGVDSIEHGGPISSETIEIMKEKGIVWVATNTIFFHSEGLPNADYQINAPGTKRAKIEQVLVPKACEGIKKSFSKVIKSNVDIALGTDSMHGLFPYELEYMVHHGATPMEAIKSATFNGARLIGEENRIGSLEVGKVADIISVPGNPLNDISLAWKVNLVMKEGKRYDGISTF